MILRLPAYPEYKDSGVEWLRESPAHWDVRRLKYLVTINPARDGQTVDPETLTTFLPMEKVGTRGEYDCTIQKKYSDVKQGFTYFAKGDLIVAKITPCFENGKGALLDKLSTPFGFGSTEFIVLRTKRNIDPKFVYYVTRSPIFRIRGSDAMSGSAGQQRVPVSFVENFPCFVPPIEEQAAIVRFLDALDRRVNRLLRIKRRLIVLLIEQKQAVIHRAVTKGLNPDALMKPSGIDWLGEIPAHWTVQRNNSLFFERIERGDAGLPILIVSLRSGITVSEETTDGRPRRLIEDRSGYRKATKGDIAYNTMRMWQGALGVSPVDGLVSPAYVIAAPRAGTSAQFFAYLYRTAIYKSEINRVSTGIVSDRNRLYWDDFKNLPSPVPPPAEQRHIVATLENEHTIIDKTIARAQTEIELIREYRTRLIADVVTGKLDVRDAILPDSFPDSEESAQIPLDEADELDEMDGDAGEDDAPTDEEEDF
ncbi:MAG: restriction endonuclease subunit S [Fibrella sp.]|nr:restriction endonuclease subunit S [Armatimonadota bacterium]